MAKRLCSGFFPLDNFEFFAVLLNKLFYPVKAIYLSSNQRGTLPAIFFSKIGVFSKFQSNNYLNGHMNVSIE